MKKAWDEIFALLKAPFVGDLDVWHLFLLVGVVLIFAAVWGIILHYVRLTALEA